MWRLLLCVSFLAVISATDVSKVAPNDFVKALSQPPKLTGFKFIDDGKFDANKLRELTRKLSTLDPKQARAEQVAILNEYVDELLRNLNIFLLSGALDPISLPSFEESFEWFIFNGHIKLFDGWLRGLSTIQRTGDAVIKYEYPNVKLSMPVGFAMLRFDYDYEVKFMSLGPDGGADGKADQNKFTIDINIDMTNLRLGLDKFVLDTLGSVSLKFTGSVAIDWLINLLVGLVIPILKPILRTVLDDYIIDLIQLIVNGFNATICDVLGDCPEQVSNPFLQYL